jgi:Ca2+-binding EF-hand superfamily protein
MTEFESYMRAMSPDATLDDVLDLMKELDSDGDGNVTKQEFQRLLERYL